MIKNFFKVALRNLRKRKAYTLINILGLATGMAVCLLIILFVQSELNYDQQHEKAKDVYRLVLDRIYPGRTTSYAFIPQSIGAAVKAEFPEVKESVRLYSFTGDNGNFFLRIGDKVFEEKRVFAADSNFFRVFSSKMLKGDAATALMKPNSVVINETTAKKYFGSVDAAFNKTFETDGNNNNNNVFHIAAICADWLGNSHFLFDILISTTGFEFTRELNYINFAAYTYLLLNPGTSVRSLESKFPVIIKKYVAGDVEKRFAENFDQFIKEGNGYHYHLQPLQKIHLISNMEGELGANGNMTAVYIFSIIAVFILFLACINFINLATARSVERAREVGIRKTFGSERKALIGQFLIESIVISFISVIVAFGLIALLLPLFNQLSGKSLSLLYFFQPLHVLSILVFAIVIGLIAGSYPAFVLSSFKPIMVLKGRFKSQKYGLALRNGLVVFQFAISVILIVCTLMVHRQMHYMLGEKIGFRKDHIIMVERSDLLQRAQTRSFKTELEKIAGVESVSGTTAMPGQQNFFGISYQEMSSKEQVTGRGIFVDDDYAKVLGLELKEGRFFSKDFSTDSLSIVLNEKAVSELKLKNPVGARLTTPEGFLNAPDGSPYVYTVIGVIKDFHFQSLHDQIAPLFINYSGKFGDASNVIAMRIKAADFKSAVALTENTWKNFVKNRPFHYSFLDQTLARQYHGEQITQKIFTVFSSLAIFIACIGLLGLAAYTTQQRTREISIRKVLGASVSNIVAMLSKDFLKLVLIAALVAFPVAWWGMHKWLQNFAYKINIGWEVFIIAALSATFVALFTISFQAIKAAMANPVKSLRSE
ncbi:MAG TPA: ABC transporter permease [Chitinophagaceae bacterium]|nr:ABC transporter permease [Chitinophagaceae bacterium]